MPDPFCTPHSAFTRPLILRPFQGHSASANPTDAGLPQHWRYYDARIQNRLTGWFSTFSLFPFFTFSLFHFFTFPLFPCPLFHFFTFSLFHFSPLPLSPFFTLSLRSSPPYAVAGPPQHWPRFARPERGVAAASADGVVLSLAFSLFPFFTFPLITPHSALFPYSLFRATFPEAVL